MKESLLVLLVALAACGGQPETPTKPEFIAAADSICANSQDMLEELPAPETLEHVADYGLEAADIGAMTMGRLTELKVPRGDETQVDAILEKFSEMFRLFDQLSDAATEGDQVGVQRTYEEIGSVASDAATLARAYGMKDCSEE